MLSFVGKVPATSWLLPLHSKHNTFSAEDDVTTIPEPECTDKTFDVFEAMDVDVEESSASESECKSTKIEGEKVIADIAEHLSRYLAVSGDTMLNALKAMHGRMQEIKTPAALESALVTFGKGKDFTPYYIGFV